MRSSTHLPHNLPTHPPTQAGRQASIRRASQPTCANCSPAVIHVSKCHAVVATRHSELPNWAVAALALTIGQRPRDFLLPAAKVGRSILPLLQGTQVAAVGQQQPVSVVVVAQHRQARVGQLVRRVDVGEGLGKGWVLAGNKASCSGKAWGAELEQKGEFWCRCWGLPYSSGSAINQPLER